MEKRNLLTRMVCLIAVYLFTYIIPIVAIHFTWHMSRLVGNFCFSFPQLMFPFNIMFWKNSPIISNNCIVVLISGFYLVMLGLLFSYVTRSAKKFRWIVLLAFCFSILSVIALNFILMVFGITVETRMP